MWSKKASKEGSGGWWNAVRIIQGWKLKEGDKFLAWKTNHGIQNLNLEKLAIGERKRIDKLRKSNEREDTNSPRVIGFTKHAKSRFRLVDGYWYK